MLMGYFIDFIQGCGDAHFKSLLHVVIFVSSILHIVGGLNILFHPLRYFKKENAI